MKTFSADIFSPLIAPRHRLWYIAIGGIGFSILMLLVLKSHGSPFLDAVPSILGILGGITSLSILQRPRQAAKKKLIELELDPQDAFIAYKVFMATLVPMKLKNGKFLSVSINHGKVLVHISNTEAEVPALDFGNDDYFDHEITVDGKTDISKRLFEALVYSPIPIEGLKDFMVYQPNSGFAAIGTTIDDTNNSTHYKAFRVEENSGDFVKRTSESRGGSILVMPDEQFKKFRRTPLKIAAILLTIAIFSAFFIAYYNVFMTDAINGKAMVLLATSSILPIILLFANTDWNTFEPEEMKLFSKGLKKSTRFDIGGWDVVILTGNGTNDKKVLYTKDPEALIQLFGNVPKV